MDEIAVNLAAIRDRISAACAKSGRRADSVELVAVSKTFPAEAIREANSCGQTVFGESRLQEAESKIATLPGHLSWHFIGRIQTNKIRKILPLFGIFHAVDSLRLANHMGEAADDLGLFPKIFLQVNVAGEATKGGFEPSEIEAELEAILAVKRLEIVGLMTIPPVGQDAESSRRWFAALRDLRDRLEGKFKVSLPLLSMGMSGDFEIAIEEGATHVRVGSAIFGKRAYRVHGELG